VITSKEGLEGDNFEKEPWVFKNPLKLMWDDEEY